MKENYYLGLDIGTNSVGYAVTDGRFNLLKYKGEPMWGSHVFEEGKQCSDRRMHRTARRRLDRRQQRVHLTQEIFAKAISEVDERFFVRLKESALFREDTSGRDTYIFFQDENYTDKEYHRDYPTIHHLIKELMEDTTPHDVRLVYLAVAWLMAHRGHFLSEVNKDNITELLDFDSIYGNLMELFTTPPWICSDKEEFKNILLLHQTIKNKERKFWGLLYEGKKPKTDEEDYINKEGMIRLLSGGTVEAGKLFNQEEFQEKISISLKKSEEDFQLLLDEMDEEDSEYLIRLRALYDWALLVDSLHGCSSISEAKVQDYIQHEADLKMLKSFVRKYCPNEYATIFKNAEKENYASYVYNIPKGKRTKEYKKKITQEEFCDYLKKKLKDVQIDEEDEEIYQDMMFRLETYTFMPKQVTGDNRVIPYQLYYDELKKILKNAENYLPFLKKEDEQGISNKTKLLSIFEFRIPYYVGPLCSTSKYAWLKRKSEGKIYPWNFEEKVDLDQSEEAFINRMTNNCSYLPGKTVLPQNSLLYCKFTVLNEINNLKINGIPISVECKQEIYKLFQENKKVTVDKIKKYLISNNYMTKEDVLGGIDVTIKSSLKPHHDFKRLLHLGILNEREVEKIIQCITYSEEKSRVLRRLEREFPKLSDEDRRYLSKLKYSGFGRLSREFFTGIHGANKETGESFSIIQALWDTNDNLMQLLSDRYTFKDSIEEEQRQYYEEHPMTVESLLEEMYVSNAVKRPIYRTLDVIKDIQSVCKAAPKKIYIEMARGQEEGSNRKRSRKDQILELYKNMDKGEVRELSKQLEDCSDRELRSEVLFLYFMQLGRSMYSGKLIDIEKLKTNAYDVDHIYPQCRVKDDSLSNKVLVLSEENRAKGDKYPISAVIRQNMGEMWRVYHEKGLISDEKYRRLTRVSAFSNAEKMEFINRQLVETRQSTKALTRIFRYIFPETEIVFVKAGLVSDFRNEVLKCAKSRIVNDLHHAKDAYLNIVAGEVYHARFTSKFFKIDQDEYSVKTKAIFGNKVWNGKELVWDGEKDIARVKKILMKNSVHYTRYAFERKGGLFDQQPLRAASGLIERKAGLDTEKYGGYNKSTASYFLLVKYAEAGKKPKQDVMFVPIDLMESEQIIKSESYAKYYVRNAIAHIIGKSREIVQEVSFPLGMRKMKVNTLLTLDGFEAILASKSNGGKTLVFGSMMPLFVNNKKEIYIKRLESFSKKKKQNNFLFVDEVYDKITKEENRELFLFLTNKVEEEPYCLIFGSQLQVLHDKENEFENLNLEQQVETLLNLLSIFKTGRTTGCDLKLLGGAGQAGIFTESSKLSNWKKSYKDVRIVDISAAGLHRKTSQNLLELL